jgi:hypothetical protein
MKLLRVVSKENDLTSFFSNEFSEAIEIPPHSTVALINGLFNVDSKSIYIPTDSVFTFKLKQNGDGITVSIPSAYYTSQSIISTVEEKLNTAIDKTTQLNSGSLENVQFLWRPSVGKSPGLFSLSFARQKQVAFDFPADNLKNLALANGIFTSSKLSGTAAQFEAFGFSNNTVIPCATSIKMNVGAQDQKYIVGLLKEKPAGSKTYLASIDFMYGCRSDGAHVHYIVNGVEVDSAPVGTVNPQTAIDITFNNGKVNFDSNQYEQAIDFDADGYFLAAGLWANTATFSGTGFNPNPFNQSIEDRLVQQLDLPLKQVLHLDAVGDPTQITLTMSDNLQASLGYDYNPNSVRALTGSFTSNNPIANTSTPTSMTVELPNLGGQISSYDGLTQRRRAIVAVIPSMLQTNGILNYEPSYPVFIDLNNPFPIQLSKLEVRLLSSFDNAPVNLDHPGCSMTFVLDHK